MNIWRVNRYLIILLAVSWAICAHMAWADCAAPATKIETASCQALMFSRADAQLSAHYLQLSAQLTIEGQEALSQQEQSWLHQRDSACTVSRHGDISVNFACAADMTAKQDELLSGWLDIPATLPPNMAFQGPFQGPRFLGRMIPPIPPPPMLQRSAAQPTMQCQDLHACVILGSAMPWQWQVDKLNSAYPFGIQDGSGPTVVTLTRLSAKPGQLLSIKFLSGEVNVGGGWPSGDASGVSGAGSDGPGSTGQFFPSKYMTPYPINLGALVGTFTDQTGKITGQPFALNNATELVAIPSGATQLQLGINDDRCSDNTGSFIVSVGVLKKQFRQAKAK
jgi:uncharacterized protein YecT (DUF1311 family)